MGSSIRGNERATLKLATLHCAEFSLHGTLYCTIDRVWGYTPVWSLYNIPVQKSCSKSHVVYWEQEDSSDPSPQSSIKSQTWTDRMQAPLVQLSNENWFKKNNEI